jgi:hypothetical protein
LEDVFDQVSFPVELSIAPSVAGSVGTWRDAGQTAIALDEVSKFVQVEAFVPDEAHGLGQKRQEMFGSGGFSAPTGQEEEGYDVSSFINGRGELRVVPAFGAPNRLILRASDRSWPAWCIFMKVLSTKRNLPFGFRARRPRTSAQRPTSTQRR